MIKFPNSSFSKYSYPKNSGLKSRAINALLLSQNYINYEPNEEDSQNTNKINDSIK